ncbi:MAG: hypothetical protein J0L84_13510 [Verrucomicrobia bacterium]|nr:hypothetical protein [Verrucomicrobiota bacterium]
MSPEERKSFLLRMDPALWRELEAWAQEELRSVNGQVEFLLREAVRRRRGTGLDSCAEGPPPRSRRTGSSG